MKTPEEIKKGLECVNCADCPYDEHNYEIRISHCSEVADDAIAYILQLERERDAAVKAAHGNCLACSHYDIDAFGSCTKYELCEHGGDVWEGKDLWQWRGVQNTEDNE